MDLRGPMQAKLEQAYLLVSCLLEGLLGLLFLFYWLVDYVLISRNANLEDQLFLSRNYVFLSSLSFLLKKPILLLTTWLLDFHSPPLQILFLWQATILLPGKPLNTTC